MVSTDAAERFLGAPFLAGVDPALRRAVLAVLSEERAAERTILLAQGQPNDHLSFLIEGEIRIERVFPEGQKETVATMSAPAVFGTTSFFRPTAPSVSVIATTDVWSLTLYHPGHEQLRLDNPRAAEALALAAVRVLAERFDMLDKRVSDYLAGHGEDPPRATEWSSFRARLFEEPHI
jgi:CRP/FNR family transcriptional regulator, cyclic AMP receptor protein